MKLLKTDLEKVLREAVEAWLTGDAAKLKQIEQNDLLASARRRLWKVKKPKKLGD